MRSAPLLLLLAVAVPVAAQTETSPPSPAQTEPAPPAAAKPAPAPARRQAGPPIAEDNSLTPAEYQAKGLPAADKPWTDTDYGTAARALEAILAADPSQLPRYGSPKSGPLFARMVAVENFAPLEKKRTPADERLNHSGRYGNAIQQFMSIYARATNNYKKAFDAELVELAAFNLELADRMRDLGDSLVKEVARNDPQHDKREEVRDRIHYSFVAVIDGALAAFPQHHAYRTSERVRFANRLATILPRLYPVLPENAKRDLPVRIEKLAADEQDPELKQALQGLREKLTQG